MAKTEKTKMMCCRFLSKTLSINIIIIIIIIININSSITPCRWLLN
jgi:hypothetical protein